MAKARLVRHHHDFVGHRAVEGSGHKRGPDPLHLVGARLAALKDGPLSFDRDGEDVRILSLQELRNPGEGSAGSYAGHEGVDAAVHLFPDLDGGGVVVEAGIGLIIELERGKGVGIVPGQGLRLADGSFHAFCLRGAHDGGSETTHQDAFLLGEALGDKEHHSIAAVHADKGQPHTCIAGGRLDDRGAGLEYPPLLGVEDHSQGGAVFDAASGIQELKLGVDGGPAWPGDSAEPQHGGLADQFGNVFGDPQGHASLLNGA